MALTYNKIIQSQVLKNESSKGQLGRNWCMEIWEVTGDGTITAVEIPTTMTVPHFYSIQQMETGAFTGTSFSALTTTGTSIIITTSAAIASGKKVRVKIEGVL